MIDGLGTTLWLGTREDRRILTALTRCAADPDTGSAWLAGILFDGTAAYATDLSVLGTIDARVDLPADRVVVPARRLRDALTVVRGDESVRLRFEPGALHLVIGDDPLDLGDEYLPTEVQIPYDDADYYPSTDGILRILDGTGTEPDDRVVTAVGINAANLRRVAALVHTVDGAADYVTVHPRGERRPIEVRDANSGRRLGVIGPITTFAASARDLDRGAPDA